MYDIVEVPADASEYSEPLGSKEKFWYGQQYLFKVARAPSGEDWAEKVCAEVARRIGLPHAEYELALWKRSPAGIRGVISRNFCRDGAALVLGNELLAEVEPDYATGVSQFHVSTHTINRVLHTIHTNHSHLPLDWDAPPQILNSAEVFIGYLLLDALVGNTDRHHENWGVLRLPDGIVHLAPTFDHASSLGCDELDSKKARRLNHG